MKTYLGDGVYADVVRGMLKLTTEYGSEPTNTIYLEPRVLAALHQFMADEVERREREKEGYGHGV